MQEKAEQIKFKKEGIKLKNQLKQLNAFTSKSHKIGDRSYNGAVPINVSRVIKKKAKNADHSPHEK